MSESQEQKSQRIKDTEKRIADQLKTLRPEIEIVEGKSKTEFVHYTVSVIKSKITISKHTRAIYINDDAEKLVRTRFFSRKEAIDAISKVMPNALEKFKDCKDSYSKLLGEKGFSIGFNYDGDGNGIYNEYEFIYFELDGFCFQFSLYE